MEPTATMSGLVNLAGPSPSRRRCERVSSPRRAAGPPRCSAGSRCLFVVVTAVSAHGTLLGYVQAGAGGLDGRAAWPTGSR